MNLPHHADFPMPGPAFAVVLAGELSTAVRSVELGIRVGDDFDVAELDKAHARTGRILRVRVETADLGPARGIPAEHAALGIRRLTDDEIIDLFRPAVSAMNAGAAASGRCAACCSWIPRAHEIDAAIGDLVADDDLARRRILRALERTVSRRPDCQASCAATPARRLGS